MRDGAIWKVLGVSERECSSNQLQYQLNLLTKQKQKNNKERFIFVSCPIQISQQEQMMGYRFLPLFSKWHIYLCFEVFRVKKIRIMIIQSWIAYYNLLSSNYSPKRETMSNDKYVSFCESCAHPISIGDEEKIEMHQKNTSKDHFVIRQSKLHAKIKTLSQKIAESADSLNELKQRIHRKVQQLIKAIIAIRDDLVLNVDREMVRLYFDHQPISNNLESSLKKIQRLHKLSYAQFTCQQMSQLINSAQRVKDKDFIKKQKPKIDKKADNLMGQFESQLRTELNAYLVAIKKQDGQWESKNLWTTRNGPTISNIQAQHQSFFSKDSQFSILEMLKQSQQKSVFSGCSQVPAMKRKWKKTSDNMSSTSNKQKGKSIISNVDKLRLQNKKQSACQTEEQSCKTGKDQSKTISQLSSFLSSKYFEQQSQTTAIHADQLQENNQRYESDSQTETSEEDESQLDQTIRQFQREILDNDQTCFAQETHVVFTTIQHLQKYKIVDALFSLKVAIVKILYYSVLQTRIPKIKFIAGDHTGYGVFFTNYCPGLKVGTQLEMRDCTLRSYKGSDQIINNSKFRIMREYEPKIKINLQGHKLNIVITQDFYYPLEDKRCTLVRQIAQILKSGKHYNYFIKRMTVKVVSIVNNVANYSLCLVGDSSGMILAYLRKDKVKNIKELDVVRLLNVRGMRGKCRQGMFGKEIMYLDSLQGKAKVLEHRFDFLQVEDKLMTLQ